MSLRALDLFAGIGGFSLGLESTAGFEIVGHCEIEPFCRAVLEQHWPGVALFGDVREVTGDAVAARCGAVDAVVGGPPCQPASVAGRRQGAADVRWLWPEFLRVVREVRPRWVVAENPLGIASLEPQGLDWVCGELEATGYEVWPVVVGAEHVGAPHKRHRVWIVAYGSGARRDERRSERIGRDGGPAPQAARPTERGAVADRVRDALREQSGRVGQEQPYRLEQDGEGAAESRGDGAGPMGDTASAGRQAERGRSPFCCGDADSAGAAVPDAEGSGRAQQGHGWDCGSWPGRDGARWPARPGEPQHEWEEPRLAYGECGGRYGREASAERLDADGPTAERLQGELRSADGDRRDGEPASRSAEQPLGRTVDGVPLDLVRGLSARSGMASADVEAWWQRNRLRVERKQNREALKAYGNAIVPQVAQVIGRAILAAEAELIRAGVSMAAGNQEGRVSEHDSKGLCASGNPAGGSNRGSRPFAANRLDCGGMGRCRVGWRQE